MGWYRHQLHKGLAAYCRERQWALDSLDHTPDLQYADLWDGIVLLHQNVPKFQELLKSGTPTVTLAMDENGRTRLPCVLQDHEAIGSMAAGHLVQRGFRRLLFCGYHDAISLARYRGFRNTAILNKATCKKILLPRRAPPHRKRGFILNLLGRSLRKEKPPFAVMGAQDELGMLVLDACITAGLKVPEQVAVLGVDNEEIVCDCASAPLSSVDNDLFRHGYEAGKLLGDLMEGKETLPKPIMIPPKRVVVRASTDTIAAENPRLAEILQHIHQHVSDPSITVKEICNRFNLSRHALEALFRAGKLNLPRQLIHDVRLRRAFVQLAHSSMSIQQIATDCGFSSSRSFCRCFRKTAGTSPQIWRKNTG